MEICRLEHVKKEYRMGETVCPLKDVNMSVNSGDFIAIPSMERIPPVFPTMKRRI